MPTTVVTLSWYTLTEMQLDSLISECCGHVLETANRANDIEVEFEQANDLELFKNILETCYRKVK